MKNEIALLLALSAVAPTVAVAAAPSAQEHDNRAAAVERLMDAWQSRILASSLPVDDARTWASRNRAKFGRLNAERLALAQRANTLGELELVLLDAPLGAGTPLHVLMANRPGDISMVGAHDVAKSSPATAPAAYAGLVFTAVTTCRVLDTRPSQGGAGAWTAGSSNLVKIGPYSTAGGGYASGPGAQGGSSTSCGLDALAGPGQIAVIMAAVSTVSQAGAGYITFYPQGAPNPGLTSVSQWYQTGYVQTSFVLIPSDLSAAVAASAFTSAGTDVIIDVVGYFAGEAAEGTVTSITAGTGLTGGTITTSGTIGLAATNLLPTVACATNQVAKWSGSAWACAADANSGGTVTAVSASAPLASSGGASPNVSLTGTVSVANGGTGQASLATNGVVFGQGTGAVATTVGVAGQVLAGTAGAPAWTGFPSINGNLNLVESTPSVGNILKAGLPFIHNVGFENTFIGETAGNLTMSGCCNTGSGFGSLLNTTSGNANTATGVSALEGNTTGVNNTAVGVSALFTNTIGINNTASGMSALKVNSTGSGNTASGVAALVANTTGSNNIALGFNAGSNLTTGSFNIHIGNLGGSVIEGNTTRIGDANQTRTFISGIRGVTTAGAAIPVLIDASGQLGTASSSRRAKDDIADMDEASHALMKLRPVTFHYKADHDPSGRTLQYGLIAEEVGEVYPGLVAHSADGRIETVMYQFLPPMMLNEMQKQQRRIDAQSKRIDELERVIEELRATRR